MQAYRVEQLLVPNPTKPTTVERKPSFVNLDYLVTWQPFVLHGNACTILKLANLDTMFPQTTQHLTWIYIAEDFEAFSAKMEAMSAVKPNPPTPDNPPGPPLPPLSS